MRACKCVGWWQQHGLGRQLMHGLQLTIDGKSIRGSGLDIIAPFTFAGHLRSDGAVEMIKQYVGLHSVLYVGQYDGEGSLYGTWDISGYQGKWLIRFERPVTESLEIEEILPLPDPRSRES